jgi:hypothetical protein
MRVVNFLQFVQLNLIAVEILQTDAGKFTVRFEAPMDKARR